MAKVSSALLASAAVALAGCGAGSSTKGAVPERQQNAATHTEQEVVNALGLKRDPSGLSYNDPKSGCSVAVVMTTKSEVETYASAGDPVASNPTKTAGVKYIADAGVSASACYASLTARLKAVK